MQTIYLDPPYGIKFGSNWQVSTRKHEVKDGKAEDATRQPEQVRAFRDTWKLGIYSYLAYLRDRLIVARDLLTETGSVFVQIGDENVHLVRSVLDEVFGSESFVSLISVKKTGGQSSNELPGVCDYLVWYAKKRDALKYRQLYFDKDPGEEGARQYNGIETPDGVRRPMTREEEDKPATIKGEILQPYPLVSIGESQTDRPFEWKGKVFRPSPNRHWSITATGLEKVAVASGTVLPWLSSTSIWRSLATICSGVNVFFGMFPVPFCIPVSLFDWYKKARSGQVCPKTVLQ